MKNWFLLFFALLMTLHMRAQPSPAPLLLMDSIVTSISSRYEARSFLHTLFMGRNYRDVWDMPISLPVLRVSAAGFSIERRGGGQQTKSLHLVDKDGRHWVLRTVDKNVKTAVPSTMNNKLGIAMVQDLISASLPYSHLIVASLANAANIPASVPQMVYVADEKNLGSYREDFGGQVCTLEAAITESRMFETRGVTRKLATDNHNRILQKQILKVRLLDMLVGDWDRHVGQWQWLPVDSAGERYYYVIPKDHDNALFHARGIIPTLTTFAFMPHIKGFKEKSSGLKQLNQKAIGFDQYFLNGLTARDWEEGIREFCQQISDEVVASTLRTLPDNIEARYSDELARKLKSRRDGLMKNGMKYYRFLSAKVEITGTDLEESFVVSGEGDHLIITVYGEGPDGRRKIYERSFDPSDTRSIVLNGLKGADEFVIEESTPMDIRLKIFGQEGSDRYVLKARSNSEIVDHRKDDNIVINHRFTKLNFR